MKLRPCFVMVCFFSLTIGFALAQTLRSSTTISAEVPRVIRYSGIAKDEAGKPMTGTVGITFSLYKEEQGGAPLWMETQNVQADATGHYTAQLGSESKLGVPLALFSAAEVHWISTQISGKSEQPRVALLSVPYALKAADAETLGGLPASAFVHADTNSAPPKAGARGINPKEDTLPPATVTGKGTKNFIPVWTGATTLGNSVIFETGGNVGVGTKTPAAAVDAFGTGTLGVQGQTNSATQFAAGVKGFDGAATGQVYGVNGNTNSTGPFAVAVNGFEGATSGQVYGVFGGTNSTTDLAAGVGGFEGSASGAVYGVNGNTNSTGPFAAAVNGFEGAATGQVYGVQGGTSSTTASAAGVSGYNNAATGQVYGVLGGTSSTTNGAAAVNGFEGADTGQVSGVSGGTSSTSGIGVSGFATATSGDPSGVSGTSVSSTGNGVAGANNATTGGTGVLGVAGATSGVAIGVVGQTQSPAGAGGAFTNLVGGKGLVLVGNGKNFRQIFNVDASGNGFFAGNLNVKGKLTKGSGSFKIDHPLEPAKKYLSHSFVESPDMMNVYNGNVTTDRHGMATVILPDYFEALNRDFRYQLTVIGQFAQAIVANEVRHNRFTIKTSKPSVKVSWQVSGIRHDAYADANRIPVEEVKPPQEQGRYLHPELFGAPEDLAIGAIAPAEENGAQSASLLAQKH